MITPTPWILSTMTANVTTPLCEGIHNLQIMSASFNEEENYYSVKLKSLDEENEESNLRYYILKKDGTKNDRAVGTLLKLGYCIYGVETVPNPLDIVNGIVRGMVKHAFVNGNEYVNIYEFNPVEKRILDLAEASGLPILKDQFCIEG